MNKKQLRDHINLIQAARTTDLTKPQELEEKGGIIDKALAALGSRSAVGRVKWKERYNDLIGDWKEYATHTGLDTNRIFAQTEFPTTEFVDFLKIQHGFDDDMIKAVKLRKKGKANIKDVFKNATVVQAKKELQDTGMIPDEKPAARAAKAAPAAAATAATPAAATTAAPETAEKDIADAEQLFTSKEIRGDLKRAVGAAKKIIGNDELLRTDDLRKVGVAYLAARGHLG